MRAPAILDLHMFFKCCLQTGACRGGGSTRNPRFSSSRADKLSPAAAVITHCVPSVLYAENPKQKKKQAGGTVQEGSLAGEKKKQATHACV